MDISLAEFGIKSSLCLIWLRITIMVVVVKKWLSSMSKGSIVLLSNYVGYLNNISSKSTGLINFSMLLGVNNNNSLLSIYYNPSLSSGVTLMS